MSSASFWQPGRSDVRAMLLVALIPILLAMAQLTPWLKAGPIYYTAQMSLESRSNAGLGDPYVDPNSGFQTHALGYRAARDWLAGEVPWWNPYSGVGMPLAAEYQPAAFFPLTLLVLLPRGMVLLQATLQILAGLGTYALLRQMGLARIAAFAGGAIYSVNGTLAWFSHGPAGVVPWLPWLLLGLERAWTAAARSAGGGWRTIAVSMAMSLLAGFPETAYFNGLFALAWATLRGFQLPRDRRSAYAIRVIAGGCVAIAIASPQVVSFLEYLVDADVGGHAGDFARARLEPLSILVAVMAPYTFGPPFAYADHWPAIRGLWAGIGGYASIALVATALYGLFARRDALPWLLAAWTLVALAKTYAIEPVLSIVNVVPGMKEGVFARYGEPTWELALVVLAASGIDHVARNGAQPAPASLAALVSLAVLGAGAIYGSQFLPQAQAAEGLRCWMLGSAAWAAASVIVLFIAQRMASSARAARGMAAILAMEAAIFCGIPILANPRHATLDTGAIDFLRGNLGLQRFFTTGPIQPNYGALFAIASINHNYLPVPRAWVRYLHASLVANATDPAVFTGEGQANAPGGLRVHLDEFQRLGVKYVVTDLHSVYAEEVRGVRRVYDDAILKIFELPEPRAYFEAVEGPCSLEPNGRRRVRVTCEAPATLVRRELHFPGWSAKLNGGGAAIAESDGLFQAVRLPAGTSDVEFRYAPPNIGWAWLACVIGLAALAMPWSLLGWKHE